MSRAKKTKGTPVKLCSMTSFLTQLIDFSTGTCQHYNVMTLCSFSSRLRGKHYQKMANVRYY